MQRVNMIKHVVNLKYGFGLDLNNYHFDDERVRFHKNPTYVSLSDTLKGAKKNKLAADYVTVPMMINFNFTPDRNNGFGLSAAVFDYNGDGWPDIYVANDFFERDYLYLNQGQSRRNLQSLQLYTNDHFCLVRLCLKFPTQCRLWFLPRRRWWR